MLRSEPTRLLNIPSQRLAGEHAPPPGDHEPRQQHACAEVLGTAALTHIQDTAMEIAERSTQDTQSPPATGRIDFLPFEERGNVPRLAVCPTEAAAGAAEPEGCQEIFVGVDAPSRAVAQQVMQCIRCYGIRRVEDLDPQTGIEMKQTDNPEALAELEQLRNGDLLW